MQKHPEAIAQVRGSFVQRFCHKMLTKKMNDDLHISFFPFNIRYSMVGLPCTSSSLGQHWISKNTHEFILWVKVTLTSH